MPTLRSGKDTNQSAESLSTDLLECCKSESLSEEALRTIIGRHRLTSGDYHLDVGDYKFFLEACDNKRVTERIIRYLLNYFPEAVSAVDDYEGWTPLHVACWNGGTTLNIINIIQLLISATPDSVRSKTNKGRTPLYVLCHHKRGGESNAMPILKFLIEKYPEAVQHADIDGQLPIHIACSKSTPEFCQVLIDAAPDSIRSVTNYGWVPLHMLCCNREVDEATSIQMLKFFIEKYPEAVRCTNNRGNLPIHLAARKAKSPEFCRVLIAAYPGSEQIANAKGALPLHQACWKGNLATVKYLYNLYSDGILHEGNGGFCPIHLAIIGTIGSDIPATAVEIVKFLLECDPDVKLQTFRERSLLYYSCRRTYDDSSIGAALQIIGAIYDVHPEAIEDTVIARNIQRYHQQVQSFINNELVFARQAEDFRLMTTPDDNGRLPLHTAIQNNVTLGSIKLLVKGNPAAVQSPDSRGALPLHIACEHHDSACVVQYLVELDTTALDDLDREGNTALHYACRGAKYDTIALLLDMYDAVSVSKRNAQNKLPIELLWESNEVEDRESVEYTESVFRLLKAYPELIMNKHPQDQESKAGACTSQNEKKRKLDAVS